MSLPPTRDVIPANCDWLKDHVVGFDPDNSQLTTSKGSVVRFDFVITYIIYVYI